MPSLHLSLTPPQRACISDSPHPLVLPFQEVATTTTTTTTLLLSPVVSVGRAASRHSMVSGRRRVAHPPARPHQQSASFHPLPGSPWAETQQGRKIKQSTMNERKTATHTQMIPSVCAQRCCVVLAQSDHTLKPRHWRQHWEWCWGRERLLLHLF